jgi:hypothetical protein
VGLTLEVEPGRSLYANAGIHLTRVENLKRQDEPQHWRWVEVDTSECFLSGAQNGGWRWDVIVANRADQSCPLVADVVGRSCGFDLLVPDAQVPASVEAGDTVAFLDTGAYDEARASNFNAMPRPGTVLVLGDEAELIKRGETYEDVFIRDMIPERLRKRGSSTAGGVRCSDARRRLNERKRGRGVVDTEPGLARPGS